MSNWNEDTLAALKALVAYGPPSGGGGSAPKSGTAARTAVSLTANTAATAKAANTSRVGLALYNGTAQTVLVAFGETASATAFSVSLVAGAYYEVPAGFTGSISAFATAASSAPHLLVTEFTA